MTRANKRKFHYVYRIDRFDGKFYIGMHSTDLMEDGYFGSGTRLSNSVRYHGRDKHSKTILKEFETREEAKDYEKLLITDEMRADTMCLNIAPGGGGGFHDEEHQRKCSSAGGKVSGLTTGPINGSKKLKELHASGNFNYATFTGRKHTEETKRKISESRQKRIREVT